MTISDCSHPEIFQVTQLIRWPALLLVTTVFAGCAGSSHQLAPLEDHSVKVPPVGARGGYSSSSDGRSKEEQQSRYHRESHGNVETRPAPLPETLQGIPLAGETLAATPLPTPVPANQGTPAPAPSDRGRRSEPPVAASLASPVPERLPPVDTSTKEGTKRVAPASSNTGVVALLEKADDQVSSGQLDQAAASLERALRIEPTNGRLWHELANIRLKQSRLDEAANLAEKSNTLARNQTDLQANNWRLIAVVRKKQGQNQEADDALAKARGLESGR